MTPIEQLLNNYFSGTITADEFERLKKAIPPMNNDHLGPLLEEHWIRFEKQSPEPISSFADLSRKLGVTNRPPSSSNRFRSIALWRVAAVTLVLLLSGLSAYLLHRNHALNHYLHQQMVVKVNSGERAHLTLPDGTEVRLNAATTLCYPGNFGFGKRTVSLSGEAYFSVAKDTLHPFVVETSEVNIQVLGTEFNVYAYDSEADVETSLVEGTVKVTTKGPHPQSILLKPNEKAVYNKQRGKLGRMQTDLHFETAWVDGELVFRSASFEELLERLSRCYGVEFDVTGNTRDFKRYTGTFNAGNVTGVLELLKFHYPLSYTFKDNKARLVVNR